MSKPERITEVYRAAGEMEALVIKGLLESSGIPCFFKSNAAPSVHVLTVDGMAEVAILVRESMAEEAKQLIRGEGHA
jgi:hypothetical protein